MNKHPIEIFHIAGTGPDRKDGGGSWFAFANPRAGMDHMCSENGLTREVAVYRAFVAVLEYMEPGSRAEIVTDLRELPAHFDRTFGVVNPPLNHLMGEARKLIEEKELNIEVKWVLRHGIRAAPYLPRNEEEEYSRII
jgi:hypothetical protein